MDILGLIAVLSFGLTCFGIGYTFGKDSNKTQKQPPRSEKLSGFSVQHYRANRLSVVPKGCLLPADALFYLDNIPIRQKSQCVLNQGIIHIIHTDM